MGQGHLVTPPCFFFKQKTAYEISTRDWSSDVRSSDLTLGINENLFYIQLERLLSDEETNADRKSVVQGKSVDLGGRRIIKKTKQTSQTHRVRDHGAYPEPASHARPGQLP